VIIGHKKHFDLHFHFFCIKHFNSVHCEQLSQLLWQNSSTRRVVAYSKSSNSKVCLFGKIALFQ
jgi:hypothetical protein